MPSSEFRVQLLRFSIAALLVSCFFSAPALNIDSLKTAAANELIPSRKIEMLHAISQATSRVDLKKALTEVETELRYSQKLNNEKAIANAWGLKGEIYSGLQMDSAALVCINNALAIATAIKDSFLIAEVYNQFGDLFKAKGVPSVALDYFNKSYALCVASKNYKGQYESLNRLSITYFDQNDFKNSYLKDKEAYEIALKTGDQLLIANSNINLGNYFYMTGKFDSALINYKRSLNYYEPLSNASLANIYSNIGDVYADKKDFKQALNYFNKALPITVQYGNEANLAHLYTSMGRCYFLSKSYNEALDYIQKSIALIKPLQEYELLAENYGLVSDLYAAQGDYKHALEFQIKVEAAKDSLNSIVRNDKVLELQTRFETFKNQKSNELLKAENEFSNAKVQRQEILIITITIVAILTALIGLLLYRFYRVRTKNLHAEEQLNKKLELQNHDIERLNNMLEIRAVRAQMDPHFIYNCLASIQYLVSTEQIADAENYIVKFSRLMRMVLENAERNTVSLDKELEMLKMYLDLESIRLKENFTYRIYVDEELLEENIEVPTLLIQPFAENAIWHGLADKAKDRMLRITIELNGHILKCIVEDNGVGRSQSQSEGKIKTHESKAVKMIVERLQLIKEQTNVEETGVVTIDLYDNNKQPAGTKVVIQLPIIDKE